MPAASLHPINPIPVEPLVGTLPKAELHLHQEALPWLDAVVAAREGRPPHDWPREAERLMRELPPGMPRLNRMGAGMPVADLESLDGDADLFVERVTALLELAAADNAVLVEIRFGGATVLRPEMMALFREAERRVQGRYPHLRAEAILCLLLPFGQPEQERRMEACLRAAREGLGGIDVIPVPYDAEADWATINPLIEPLAAAGLGVTVHAGEFSTANLAAALRVPGVSRIGHAVYAARDPYLLELLARSGATVECCPTSNVVLGAVASYEDLPIRRLMQAGIPVTLNTDNPLRLCARIGREYAVTAALGFSPVELLNFTRNAVRASFTTASRRSELTAVLDAWEAENILPG